MNNNIQNNDNCVKIGTSDRRTRRTEQAIKTAFLDLIQQKKLDQITISELAEKADINRKTFYNHYQDIYQVLGAIEDDYANLVIDLLEKSETSKDLINPEPFFNQLSQEIESNKDQYLLILTSGEQVRLSKKIKIKLKQHLANSNYHQIKVEQDNFDLFLDFMLAGAMSIYEQWFLAGCQDNLSQLSDFICRMVVSGATIFLS